MTKIDKAQGRSVTEWVGKYPDSMPPPTVRARIFERHNRICHLTGMPIDRKAWDLDHIKALEDGGLNIESNLAPVLRVEHLKKTMAENTLRKESDRKKLADIGAKALPQHPLQSRSSKPEKAPLKVALGDGGTNLSRRFR